MINKRPRGRPRAFDRDVALATAARTFWEHGFEGTSIADLTEAMRITPQSLYAAFHSKADLYHETLQWYRSTFGGVRAEALEEEPDVIACFSRILFNTARHYARGGDQPLGCMIASAVLNCASENRAVGAYLADLRLQGRTKLQRRLERAVKEGQLRADTDATGLARYLAAIIQGMSVQARDGATEEDLRGLAHIAVAELKRHLSGARET
ncbi:TetR/AcrR family transcriptional regulator [Methylovirgula sp. 4M-Z18]|uniref:TetR/AcrR family transcriptional regulator n=1 Tax=Methylovirgula sp. 4M-Z18 TaxID=2293567 RepID=UPI000E2F28DA|nr:TetR/AcrR family transcriptional regulator [Methylovirgula sp. 4M-Z18]RFB79540.1 TetR/AcrR family transcriptional regulator [Methylovirgula sp. 4M-Z18]